MKKAYCDFCGKKVVGKVNSVILDDVISERNRQHDIAIGGNTDAFDESNTRNDWVAYICAYAGRASHKVRKNEREGCIFRDNMVKVAALAIAAIEAHDKGWC